MPDAPAKPTRQGQPRTGMAKWSTQIPSSLRDEVRAIMDVNGEASHLLATLGMCVVAAMPDDLRRDLVDQVVLRTHRTRDEFNPEPIWDLLKQRLTA